MLNQVASQCAERTRLTLQKVARKHLNSSVEVSMTITLFSAHRSQHIHIWDEQYGDIIHNTSDPLTLKQAINWIKGL